MSLLVIHLWVAFLVAALAVVAVWRRPFLRVTLYVVTLQIILGALLVAQHARAPWYHYLLALVGYAGYMAASAMMGRGNQRNGLIVAGVSSVLILLAYYVGIHAVKTGYTGG